MTTYKSRTSPGEAVEVARNVYPYPSFELPSGTVTIRENLCINPNFETNAANWIDYSSTSTQSTAFSHSGSASLLVTPSINAGGAMYSATLEGGVTYTGSAWVYVDGATKNLRVAAIGTVAVAGPTVLVPANTWMRLSVTFTPAATAPHTLYVTGTDSTTPFYVDDVLLEASPTVNSYFDGNTPDAGDFEYAWSGAENASTSIMQAKGILGVTDDGVYQSQEWAAEGDSSACVPEGKTLTVALAEPSTVKVVARNIGQMMTVGGNAVTSVVADETLEAYGDTSVVLGPGWWDMLTIVPGVYTGPPFAGSTAPHDHTGYGWAGQPNESESIQYESDFTLGDQWWVLDENGQIEAIWLWSGTGWTIPGGGWGVPALASADLWTGARSPRWIVTVLDSEDREIGELTGVRGGQAEMVNLSRLGGSARLDLTRQARVELDFMRDRVRLAYDPGVPGLEPWPVGVYLLTSPTELNNITRQESIGLLPKMVVPDEDTTVSSYSLEEGEPIIPAVVSLIQSTGENRIAVTGDGATTTAALVWEAGESKLTIINDLLTAAGYRSLWTDGTGQFRVEPYVDPGSLAISRTFAEGEASIHKPGWSREQDLAGIPNRVVVVSPGTDSEPAIIGIAENNDPDSPFSIPARGRVITRREEVSDIADQAAADGLAARYLQRAMSPVARLNVEHAIVPLDPGARVRFISGGETRDATVQRMTFALTYDAQCRAEWREMT